MHVFFLLMFCSYEKIHENRMASWRLRHTAEGYSYYPTAPLNYQHVRTMSRLDFYALIRIRSCTAMTGHDDCVDKEDRHHWTSSTRYLDGRLDVGCLYDNKKVRPWIRWIWLHDMPGLGIPSNTARNGNIHLTYGNPFDGIVCIIRKG